MTFLWWSTLIYHPDLAVNNSSIRRSAPVPRPAE